MVSTLSICQFEFRFRYRTETKKVVSVGHYSDANSELWRPRFAMVASKLWIWRETWTRWICKWQNAFLHAFITANKTEKAFRFICCAMNDKSWKLQFKNEFYAWIISYSKHTAWIWIQNGQKTRRNFWCILGRLGTYMIPPTVCWIEVKVAVLCAHQYMPWNLLLIKVLNNFWYFKHQISTGTCSEAYL